MLLVAYTLKQDHWQPQQLSHIPCKFVKQLVKQTGLLGGEHFPKASQLTKLAKHIHPNFGYRFVTQTPAQGNVEYYENRIAKFKEIPTRSDNWHDFMNALIWMQFPQTKAFISELHARDIAAYGLTPRTPRRDRLTHFDECGMLLVIEEAKLETCRQCIYALSTHQWQQAFIELAPLWHSHIIPCLFGHATAEALLCPFIGLTAKWLIVPVADDFQQLCITQQRHAIDTRLIETLKHYEGLNNSSVLRPIPLLGIPNWHGEQSAAFYANADYFRAQRNGVSLTQQYPPRWPL